MPTPYWLLPGRAPGVLLPFPFFSFPLATGTSLKNGPMVPLDSLKTP